MGGEHERLGARVEAGQQVVADGPEAAQRLQAGLARVLRAVAAGHDHFDPRPRQRAGRRHERAEVLARGAGGDAQHVGPPEAEPAPGGPGIRVRAERGIHAAGHDGHPGGIGAEQRDEL